MPHYLREIRRIRGVAEACDWIYYKFPWFFPLREFPANVELELTNECNFACPHCPRTVINKSRGIGFMDYAVCRKVVEEVAGRVYQVQLVGLGEPSLHPELDAIMRLLRDYKITTVLNTNGTLFERYSPSTILEWGLAHLVVSVDGVDERSFKRLRAGGDYWRLRANLAKFRRTRDKMSRRTPFIEIRHVIMPNETSAMLRDFSNDWQNGLGDTTKYNFFEPASEHHREEDPHRPPCRNIRRELYVRFDGRVPLCGFHGEWIGDVRTATVREIWHSARLEDVRRRHKLRDLSAVSFCKTCAFR